MKLTTPIVILVASACSHGKATQSGVPANGPIAGQNASVSSFSCFSYSSGDASHKHITCTATRECSGVMQQVKGMSGMTDVTSCAVASSVWCYHQETKDGADSGDVCQPSAEDCAQMRKDAMAAQQHVDSDCAMR